MFFYVSKHLQFMFSVYQHLLYRSLLD